jgi:hypothetical protein
VAIGALRRVWGLVDYLLEEEVKFGERADGHLERCGLLALKVSQVTLGRLEEIFGYNHPMVRCAEALFADLNCFKRVSVGAEDVVTVGLSAFAILEVLAVGDEVTGHSALFEV